MLTCQPPPSAAMARRAPIATLSSTTGCSRARVSCAACACRSATRRASAPATCPVSPVSTMSREGVASVTFSSCAEVRRRTPPGRPAFQSNASSRTAPLKATCASGSCGAYQRAMAATTGSGADCSVPCAQAASVAASTLRVAGADAGAPISSACASRRQCPPSRASRHAPLSRSTVSAAAPATGCLHSSACASTVPSATRRRPCANSVCSSRLPRPACGR